PTADLHATVAGLADPLGASPGRGRAVRDAVDGDETPAMEATFVLLSQAHHWLAHGHYDAAAGAAEMLGRQALACGRLRLAAKAEIVRARVAFALRDERTAIAALGRALAIAAPENSIRLFVDEGEEIAELLTLCLRRKIHTEYVAQLLDAFGAGPLPAATVDRDRPLHRGIPAAEDGLIVEALSDREVEV
ncbi:MAG: hypothetical protein KDE24_25995, partial [Caldilinea sp.]|nr:hypothetical protein [Caldilinea sp.]